jgi:aspartyl-tRNA(Asn)/glutamyl-tRNA(Gln) amidotransferase subunit B
VLVDVEGLADYAEAAVAALQDGTARDVVNWCTGDLLGYLNESGLSPVVLPLAPDGLAELVGLVARRELSRNQAKEVLDACLKEPKRPKQVMEERGLAQVSDEGALASVVDDVFAANADVVEEWRAGDDKVRGKKRGFLVGEAMKALKGAADGKTVQRLVDERLQA